MSRKTEPALFGIAAEFENESRIIEGAHRAREAGYRKMDAYTPLPVHGLAEAIGFRDNRIPWIVFLAGVAGAFTGFALQWWVSAVDYPINVGGKPYVSWPAFIPITFECTVLFAAIAGVVGMFALNGLPRPYHSIFNAEGIERASTDRFFLCIEADDPQFDGEETATFLRSLEPLSVTEVPE